MNASKTAFLSALVCAAALTGATGCATMERSHVVTRGTAEVVAGFSQDDIDWAVGQAVAKLNQFNARYAVDGARRVVNIKDVTNDTLSRGINADALSEQLGQSLREELTNAGFFIVYNERMALAAAARGQPVTVLPEFVLYGKLQQRNMRRDGGNVYQEFSLNLQLVDVNTNLEIWQTRIPLQKGVDRRNAMAN